MLVFFTFSTTQEYYSMPCYPALRAAAGLRDGRWWKVGGTGHAGVERYAACAALAAFTLWFLVRNMPAPGDISSALSPNPGAYTLSLGHMQDLTMQSFAYLRAPLLMAAVAFAIGLSGCCLARAEGIPGSGGDDGVVFSGGARGAGDLRSLSLVAAAGGGAAEVAAGTADRGSSLLHVLVGVLLHRPRACC